MFISEPTTSICFRRSMSRGRRSPSRGRRSPSRGRRSPSPRRRGRSGSSGSKGSRKRSSSRSGKVHIFQNAFDIMCISGPGEERWAGASLPAPQEGAPLMPSRGLAPALKSFVELCLNWSLNWIHCVARQNSIYLFIFKMCSFSCEYRLLPYSINGLI